MFCSIPDYQRVSLSVTEVLLFEISNYPSINVFGAPKDGSDGGGHKKVVEFSLDLIKSIFIVSRSLGQMQYIMFPCIIQHFFESVGDNRRTFTGQK